MNKFYTLLITILGWLSCFSASAQADSRYYLTDGTEIQAVNGLTSGYYIIRVLAGQADTGTPRVTGMLYWNGESQYSHFGFQASKDYSDLVNKALDIQNAEDVKYIFYISVDADNNFTIKSVGGSRYISKQNAQSATSHQLIQDAEETDRSSRADFTINFTKPSSAGGGPSGPLTPEPNGKKHFIVKLAGVTTSAGDPVYLHKQIYDQYHALSYYTGYNEAGGSCNKLAFFKLSPVACFTYDYQINGESVKTESKTVDLGSDYPDLCTMPAFCSATKPTGTVSEADNNTTKVIPVTWSGEFQYTKTLDNANWYYLNFYAQKIVITNTGEGQNIPIRTTATPAATTAQTLSSKELWAFVGNPFDGFKIYSAYKSEGKYGRLVTTTTEFGTNQGKNVRPCVSYADDLETGKTDVWTISKPATSVTNTIPNSFFIGIKGENYLYNMNNAADYLTFWTGGQGNNSAFTVNQDISGLINSQISFKNGGDGYYYSTFYADFPIKVNENFVEIYTGTLDEANGRIIMQKAEDGIIPANTGVVIRVPSENAMDSRTYALTNETPELQKASISGTVEDIPLTDENRGNYLVFSKSGDNLGFFAAGSGITSLAAYKAFLEKPTGQAVRGFKLSFDETTSIDASTLFGGEANTLNPAAPIYDLSGRRVQRTTRGIYIQQGKKVFVK